MIKKLLFCTCLTEYCDRIFNSALTLAIENDAELWIYHGLGRQNLSKEEVIEALKRAEVRLSKAYADQMKRMGFTNYRINVSEGDVAGEILKLARNAGMDMIILGISARAPIGPAEKMTLPSLGSVATETIKWAPCPVLVVPSALIAGLSQM